MGRGLSKEQKHIFALAFHHTVLENYEVFTCQQVLREVYGLRPGQGYDDTNERLQSTTPEVKTIRSAFYRSLKRLEERGLIDPRIKRGRTRNVVRDRWAPIVDLDWGHVLTNAGKLLGERFYRLIKSQDKTLSTDNLRG